jgi:tetratricopeptide (TPR) repeat protein
LWTLSRSQRPILGWETTLASTDEQKDCILTQKSQNLQHMMDSALQHHRNGRLSEAEQIYRQILAVNPRHPDCLHLLGMIAYQAGDLETAADLIRKAIAIHDTGTSYYVNLGTVLQAQGKLDEAVALYRHALTLKPNLTEIHVNLGNVLLAQGELDESVACFERALALKPDSAEAHNNLGNALQSLGKLDDAMVVFERALSIKPDYAEVHYNMGGVRRAQDKLDEAVDCYHLALTVRPDYPEAHYNLGNVLREQGNVDAALAQYRIALNLRPDYAQAAFGEAVAQLLQGEFAVGWRNYGWRWKSMDHDTPNRAYSQPAWSGEKLASGSLLIWGEQGVGDEIMFAGLLPDVTRTGNRCVLDCNSRLNPLFARSFPGITVVSGCGPGSRPELEIAAQIPSGSLPGLFRNTTSAFSSTTSPYLIADPTARERLRTRYADGRRLVGLAWYTNSVKTGRSRCIDLSLFAPLFARPDIRWISLQYGDHDELENRVAAADAPILIDREVDQLSNMDLFAAQIAAMDLVITIDNSTAHLAAALGDPVWVLLPFAPDWRWLLETEGSPWYPTMRLFRQPKLGDWQSVVEKVNAALAESRP